MAMSAGISLTIRGSTSKRERSTAGIRYCRASILVISSSGTKPSFDQDVAQAMLAGLLLGHRRGELLAREESFAQQHLTEPFAVIAWQLRSPWSRGQRMNLE